MILLGACADDAPVPITIAIPAGTAPAIDAALRDLVELTPDAGLRADTAAPPSGLAIEVAIDLSCVQCYRMDATGPERWTVHAGDLLGAQYGVAHMLENLGFRFRTPTDTYIPAHAAFDPAATASLDVLHTPKTPGHRGLQLHTLHPIEAHFALWTATDDTYARRIFDWIVKNRGNHVQWPALDDIMQPARHTDWQAMTQTLLADAHARGLTVGLGVQMFGASNMQRAFDLSDDDSGTIPFETEMQARLPLVTAGLPFDDYVLAFGEFSGTDPDRFIAAVNATVAALRTLAPAAKVEASIHVGKDLRVTYRGEDLPFYFLVKYADPAIVPNLHTVMFYNLFEDAGGAYGHDDFAEHRAYLLDRMRSGAPAVYYPESAYWVAFDNSVPLFLPLYVRSRWLDLTKLDEAARAENMRGLDGHLVFSSGWEWGYWLNDYASLRASYELPGAYRDLIADAFGADLAPAVDIVTELADVQADALIHQRLAPYLAGRDTLIDAGDRLGIHSQPDRITLEDLVTMSPDGRAAFAADRVAKLDDLATSLEALSTRAAKLHLESSRWSREVRDGLAVTAARARYVTSTYQAALAQLAGEDPAPALARMTAALDTGTAAVTRRDADPHHDGPAEQLYGRPDNVTVYGFGYLYQAHTLCYWHREQVQLANLLGGVSAALPSCIL